MSEIRKIEQGRAAKAFECISNHAKKEKVKGNLKEYKSYVKKLPMLIKVNGLGPAIAFVYSKKQKVVAYEWLYNDIVCWIKKSHYLYYIKDKFNGELVDDIINLNSQEYRAVTKEVLAFLNWLKRFVDGKILDEEDSNDAKKE